MKKVILALAIVSVSFAACNSNEKKEESTTPPADSVTAPVTTPVDTAAKTAPVDTAAKAAPVDTTKKAK